MEVGQIVEGKYRITRLIGEGGMGAVYEGENMRISRRVAIKVLHAGLTENAEVTQRFEREAQAAGRIGNDHILEVLDLGSMPNGDHYIVMEYLDGEPLSARIKAQSRMQPYDLAPLVRQMLVGLGAAHRAGIVHRDLKPDNVFILKEKAGKKDFVKIIDFGISKFQPLNQDGMRMTRTGTMMGTPYYMSPEQASGTHEADQRSDLYAVGVIMFEATTGQVPFDAATFNQLLFKIVLDDVPKPETLHPDMDPAFASLISKAMARDREQRFQTAEQFMEAIDAWLQRGAAVSVPPTADPAAAALVRPRAALTQPSQQMPAGTGGTWATSQFDELPKRSSKLPLIAAVAAVLIAGGAAAAVLLRPSAEPSDAPPEAAASVIAPVPPAPEPVAVPAPPPLPEPVAVAPAEPAAGPSAEPEPETTPEPAPRAAARPRRTTPRAAPAPAPAPAPVTTATQPKRRDFGY